MRARNVLGFRAGGAASQRRAEPTVQEGRKHRGARTGVGCSVSDDPLVIEARLRSEPDGLTRRAERAVGSANERGRPGRTLTPPRPAVCRKRVRRERRRGRPTFLICPVSDVSAGFCFPCGEVIAYRVVARKARASNTVLVAHASGSAETIAGRCCTRQRLSLQPSRASLKAKKSRSSR